MSICEKAMELRARGCNCAQSVLGGSAERTGLDEKTALAVSGGFGAGLRSGEICGAISGAVMALGLMTENKARLASLSRDCVESFRRDYGCVRCQELKARGVSCNELIMKGARFVEEQE